MTPFIAPSPRRRIIHWWSASSNSLGAQFSASRVPTWNEHGRSNGRACDAQREHEAIYAAIAAGDAQAARETAERHLREGAKRLGNCTEESAGCRPSLRNQSKAERSGHG